VCCQHNEGIIKYNVTTKVFEKIFVASKGFGNRESVPGLLWCVSELVKIRPLMFILTAKMHKYMVCSA